jgi:hypothetical protein
MLISHILHLLLIHTMLLCCLNIRFKTVKFKTQINMETSLDLNIIFSCIGIFVYKVRQKELPDWFSLAS